ncbi:ephrin-A4 isoform X2 [Hippocampus comes]|uniref:ephrin-A4 isoform X2 n=1 Tax=Hippocampus comes TaxID=109280 RepID=UPI00094EC180|nr:PREDICTED: ephrin-A4-like isoform X2 [Hippocampus comes]
MANAIRTVGKKSTNFMCPNGLEGAPGSGDAAMRLTAGELSIQVNLNDYLDFYCPYYPSKQMLGPRQPETLALYLTEEAAFQGCVETTAAIKRWECNTPFAPFGSVRFSEKIQRFTPFSLGFEFLPGRHYYYSSLRADEGPPLPCMKLRVTVCCETGECAPLFISSPSSIVISLPVNRLSLLPSFTATSAFHISTIRALFHATVALISPLPLRLFHFLMPFFII